MNISDIADSIVKKFKPGDSILKEWMHAQFNFEFKYARATEAIVYACERGALRQELLLRNRVLAPLKGGGWKVLTKQEHGVYAEKVLRRRNRQGVREAGEILNATDMRGMSAAERKAHEDAKNFVASFRDMSEKMFKRNDVFVTFGTGPAEEEAAEYPAEDQD